MRDTAVIRRGCPPPVAASQGWTDERGYVISADCKPGRASLTMLEFSGDEFDALELVHRATDSPVDIGTGFSHLAIQIDNLKATVEAFPWGKQHRQIPPPAQSPESGDYRSPHSVSGSNCNHGVEGGDHGNTDWRSRRHESSGLRPVPQSAIG